MVATKMTLKEILEHMKELSDSGMGESDSFYQAHTMYIETVLETKDQTEISMAIAYLIRTDHSIGTLNVSNMIDELNEKLSKI